MAARRAIDRATNSGAVAAKGRPATRTERARGRMLAGDWAGAFRAASKISGPTPGERETLTRAYEATLRPEWCRQLGQDPDAIVEAARVILARVLG